MGTILVTGAKGQLGSEIQKISSSYSQQYIFTDIEELDLTDSEALHSFLVSNPAGYIVNCAAYTQVDKAEDEPEKAMLLNRDAVRNLANAMKEFPDTRLIHISTDYVFAGSGVRPLKEDDPTEPGSVYGRTKLEGELVLDGHPGAMVIRTSWLYGVFGNNFVKGMFKRLQARQELGIVFDQTGSPTHAADLAEAIMQIISEIEAGKQEFIPGIYHFANEGVCSWYDLTVEMRRILKSGSKISPIETHEYPLPASRPAYSVLNKRKIREVYGVMIPHWRDSLEKCIKELLSQPS